MGWSARDDARFGLVEAGASSVWSVVKPLRLRVFSLMMALASVALGGTACEGANVKVPVTPASEGDDDVDDDNDETPIPCGDASMCRGEERVCHQGFCVECVEDKDCEGDDRYCERERGEFECERRTR